MQKRFLSTLTTHCSKLLFTVGLLATSSTLFAQKTTSASPYSQFGLGQMREDLLPQNRAMGGLSTGVRNINGVYNTNPSNPASYSAVRFSTFDAGLYGNITKLDKTGASNNTADFAFSHITMTFPLKRFGGLSLGILPFSDVGFRSSTSSTIENIKYQTVFSGEGGLTKAYAGWGANITKNVSIGANVGYLFGTLNEFSRVEFPYNFGAINAQRQDKREIQGIVLDYGAQYYQPIDKEYALTIGYSGSLNNRIKDRATSYTTRVQPSQDDENQQIALDTINATDRTRRDLNLPMKHSVGITFARSNRWLVGADFKYADWTGFQVRKDEGQLKKNYGVAVGGQWTPDVTSLKYLKNVDYRLGFRYNKTQYFLNNQNINDMAVTVGFGVPFARNQFTGAFSKVNLSAELGQMGSINNNLIRERYININIGFTLNDRWFRRNQLD